MPARILIALLLGFAPVAAQSALVSVSTPDLRAQRRLAALGHEVLSIGPSSQLLVPGRQAMSELRRAGFTPSILEEDLEAHYVGRLLPGAPDLPIPVIGAGALGGFFSATEITAFFENLAALAPTIVRPAEVIGTTHEGRPIHAWKISDRPLIDEAEPCLLLDAAQHAREAITPIALAAFAERLVDGYGSDPLITRLVNTREIWFVPLVNPDGWLHNEATHPNGGGLWRKNRRDNGDGSYGVDCNRNWGHAFGQDDFGSSPLPTAETYRGPAAFSEPCVRALRDLAQREQPQFWISAHSFGAAVLLAPSHSRSAPLPPTLDGLAPAIRDQLAESSARYAVESATLLLPAANGTTIDWAVNALDGGDHCFAVAVELGGFFDGFWPQPSRIEPIAQEFEDLALRALELAGPALRVTELSAVNRRPSPDLRWEPGDFLDVQARLENIGLSPAQAELALSPRSLGLVNATPLGATLPLAPGASVTSALGALTLQVQPGALPGTRVQWSLQISSAFGVPSAMDRSYGLSASAQTLLAESFESGANGWHAGAPGDDPRGRGRWVQDDPHGVVNGIRGLSNPEDDHTAAGTHCWFTGQGPTGGFTFPSDHDVDGTTTLTGPRFDASDLREAEISWCEWVSSDKASDTFRAELSNDDGLTWVCVHETWVSRNRWVRRRVRIEDWLPRSDRMRMRFRAISGATGSVFEAGLDDFRVTGLSAAVTLSSISSSNNALELRLLAPDFPQSTVVFGLSQSITSGTSTPAGRVPLDFDATLAFALDPVNAGLFDGFVGLSDASGAASATLRVPAGRLAGLELQGAALVFQGSDALAITGAETLILN